MQMMVKSALVAVILVGLMAMPTLGTEKPSVGLIDFQKILETSTAGKAAQAEINVEGKKMEADLKQKGDEIKDLEKKLERERMVLSKEAQEEKQREVRIKINDFKSLQAKYRSDIKKLESRVIKRIQDEILGLVEQIAKDNDYQLIMEKRAGGVIYSKENLDITAMIIEKYDQQVAAGSKKPQE